MKRVWFVTNRASGSASAEKCEALEAVFAERGLTLAGRTDFPAEAVPMLGGCRLRLSADIIAAADMSGPGRN